MIAWRRTSTYGGVVALAGVACVAGAALGCSKDEQATPVEGASQVYTDEGARAMDVGARQRESADADELRRLYAARASLRGDIASREKALAGAPLGEAGAALADAKRGLDASKRDLANVEASIATQRAKVEANRDKLVALERETAAALALAASGG